MAVGGQVRTEDGNKVTLQQVMIFFSVAEREPPLGFAEKPRLEFIEGDLAMANTCSPTLKLPINHSDYVTFCTHMTLSEPRWLWTSLTR